MTVMCSGMSPILVLSTGQWWQAMQMLDAMLRVGLQVRLVLLSFVQVDSEVEMFREDDTISNNALISSCEKGGLWEQSLAQLTRIRHTFVYRQVPRYS